MFSAGLYWEMRTEHRICKEGFANQNDMGGLGCEKLSVEFVE